MSRECRFILFALSIMLFLSANAFAQQTGGSIEGTIEASLLKVSPATRPEPLSGQFQVDGASGGCDP